MSVMLLWCCVPTAKVRVAPPPIASELENRVSEVDALVKKGCYVGFKRAIQAYEELYSQPSTRNRIAVPFVKTLILMTVRERELGILNGEYIKKARDVIKENPPLQSFALYVELENTMYPRTKGIMKDADVEEAWKIINNTLKNAQLKADMKLKAQSDDYYAYLFVTYYTRYLNYLDQKEELSSFAKLYPDSILFKYKTATADFQKDPKLLEALVGAETEFYEAYYYLGKLALDAQKEVEAETEFLKAYEGILESPQITIYLGGIYISTEEYDKGIEYFDKTLALAPTNRDALLGKSLCLSYMGKHKEAIDILNKLVALGSYLMGEGHYWLAWNYHELKDTEKAQFNIEESKTRLPTDSQVFGLSGTIALEKGEVDEAEREFQESLRYNGKNIDAILGLGKVYAQKKKWLDSAIFYSHATEAAAQRENTLADMIRQINDSTLAEERKARMVAKKEEQLKTFEVIKAAGYYNAAAGYFNAGQKGQALEMARKATAYPHFKEAAEKLIKLIK